MQLVKVTDRSSHVHAEAFAILRDAIAPEAQLPRERFDSLLAAGKYRLLAYVDGEDVQGVALVYFADELRFAWLDYFAIRSDLRARGLGTNLLREIVHTVSEQSAKPDWLLFEVDDDYEGDAQREANCKRRVEFYRRLGARVLQNVPYKFPSAFGEPIRMRLMAYEIRSGAMLTADHLKNAVRAVFLNIHGRGSDDSLLRWFEQNLPHVIEMK